MLNRIKKFFMEAKTEFRHVNWPTRAQAIRLTSVVIVLSLAVAVFLGAFDELFSLGLKTFILKI